MTRGKAVPAGIGEGKQGFPPPSPAGSSPNTTLVESLVRQAGASAAAGDACGATRPCPQPRAESRELSPVDVVLNAGKKRKRELALAGIPLRSVDFMRTPDHHHYDEVGDAVPLFEIPGGPSSEALVARGLRTTIADHLASGQMKVDPRTKNFVPNDIFVQAMGPDGVLPEVPQVKKHSKYRGVTRHRKSGRWESHIWIKETGKQMYLGAYENEVHAAEAYDVAALKIKGEEKARLNFDASKYSEYKELLETLTLAELVKTVKSKVPATVRLASSYKGVYYSTKEDMWEAKYQPQDKRETRSLGFFEHDIEAAKAFDREMVLQHGTVCGVNFKHTDYEKELLLFHERELQRLDSKTSEE